MSNIKRVLSMLLLLVVVPATVILSYTLFDNNRYDIASLVIAVVSTLAAPAFIDTEFLNVHRISVTADAAFTLLNLIGMTESKSIIISIKAVF